MSDKTAVQVAGEIVSLLMPLNSDERLRVVRASLVLLGEEQSVAAPSSRDTSNGEVAREVADSDLPSRAQIWAKQNGITADHLEQLFHISGSDVTMIAAEIPGKTGGEKAVNAYLLVGLQKLLSSGTVDFDDKSARALCEAAGCYDSTNHSRYLAKNKENYLSGNKDRGWELTGPGQKRAAALVKEFASSVGK